MNSVQYCQEIYTPHFLPLYELLGGADNDIEMVEDNSLYIILIIQGDIGFCKELSGCLGPLGLQT